MCKEVSLIILFEKKTECMNTIKIAYKYLWEKKLKI